MKLGRGNLPFHSIDLSEGFIRRDEVAGITVRTLSDDLDPHRRCGSRTRLLRLAPGTATPAAHAHDYWEEIYVIEGSMLVYDGSDGEKLVTAPAYAAREPGFMHGPVRSDSGCLMIDFCWYPSCEDR